jgi:type I restriction enzyme S subunit
MRQESLCLRDWRPGVEAKSSLIRFRQGDMLFGAMRPYFHKVAIAPFAGTTRTTCFVLRVRERLAFAYAVMTLFDGRTVAFASSHASGTTIPYARWDGVLGSMPTLLPPPHTLRAFEELVSPLLAWLSAAGARILNLRAARDLLLPRLVAGEIDVTDLDIAVPDLVA